MSRRRGLRAVLVLAVVALSWQSVGAWAQPPDPEAELGVVRDRRAEVAAELDVLEASDVEVADALGVLNADLSAQLDAVAAAKAATAAARDAEAAADAEVVRKQAEVDELGERLKVLAVGLYVRPPAEDFVTAAVNADTTEAPARFALARFRVEDVSNVLSAARRAKDDLQKARKQAMVARADAERRQAAEEVRLGELEVARARQQSFAEQVSERIDRALGELAVLEELDRELAAEVQRRQLDLAARLAAAPPVAPLAVSLPEPEPQPAPSPSPESASPPVGGPSSGTTAPPTTPSPTAPPVTAPPATAPPPTAPPRQVVITPVATSWVSGIEVAVELAPQLRAMIDAAAAEGITLSGSGYRNILDQIEIRKRLCGPTDYDIWDRPSYQCNPPVARPGYSMHEKGLAVDFIANGDLIRSQSHPAFVWLSANAARFGFYNLPSEPWHWSINGR